MSSLALSSPLDPASITLRRARWLAATAAIVAGAGGLALPGHRAGVPASPRTSNVRLRSGLAAVPLGARPAVGATLGRVDPAYWFRGLRAANPAQRLRVGFSAHGMRVASGHGVLGLSLIAFGRPGAESRVAPEVPGASGNRAVYDRGIVREWYTNRPLGVEQGFDVARAPAGASGVLLFSMAVSGDLRPHASGNAVRFAGAGASLSYGGLIAVDATGRRLPAAITVRAGRLILSVDARGARYPLRVDPTIAQFTQTAFLDTPTSTTFGDDQLFDESAAVSGSTLVVGAPGVNLGQGAEQGAVYVYQEPAGGWANTSTPTATLSASDGTGFDAFGDSVAISPDGGTIVASAPYHAIPHGQGAVYVFTGSGGTWTQQAELTEATPMGDISGPIGTNGSLATNGSTVVVGTNTDLVGNTGLLVYNKPGGGWATTGTPSTELGPPGSFVSAGLGADGVAMSANTIVAGDTSGGGGVGAAYVYVNGGSGFPATPTAVLTASNATSADVVGESVAISSDGNTIVAGDPQSGSSTANGSVYVYAKPSGGWTSSAQTAELSLPASSTGTTDLAGTSVGISGGMIVAGAPDAPGLAPENNENGGVFVFNEPASGWADSSAPAAELVASGALLSQSRLGRSVAISGTAVFGTAPVLYLHGFPATYEWTGPYTGDALTVTRSGSGTVTSSPPGISCGSSCTAEFTPGSRVTLTEAAASGWTFGGWSGGGCSGTATTCTVTMSSAQTVTAAFKPGTTPPPPPPPRCTIHPRSNKVQTKGKPKSKIGKLTVSVTCTESATATVRAKLKAQGKKPRHGKAKTRTFSLGAVHGSAGANVALTLAMKLPASALTALKRGEKESVVFMLKATNANGTATATATIARLRHS